MDAAMRLISKLRREFQHGKKELVLARTPRGPSAAPRAPAHVVVDLTGKPMSVFLTGFVGSAEQVLAKLTEAGYTLVGARVGEMSSSGKSREVLFESEEQALVFHKQVMARRPNDSVSASKPALKVEKDSSSQLADELKQMRSALSTMAQQMQAFQAPSTKTHEHPASPRVKKVKFEQLVQKKKKICRYAAAGEPCPRGSECWFSHLAEAKVNTPVVGICYQFRDHGTCKFGNGCRFSHAKEEVTPRKPICFQFQKHGVCSWGETCKFGHGKAVSGTAPVPKFVTKGFAVVENPAHEKEACRDHAHGKCHRAVCKFSHA